MLAGNGMIQYHLCFLRSYKLIFEIISEEKDVQSNIISEIELAKGDQL